MHLNESIKRKKIASGAKDFPVPVLCVCLYFASTLLADQVEGPGSFPRRYTDLRRGG